jgi:hypothetical protein
MDHTINIITRSQIPNNIYLCTDFNKDWDMIHSFEFQNGLQFIIGSNHSITSAELIIEDMDNELELVLNNNTPADLQSYYYHNIDTFINYNDCIKIWNYYINNQHLIKEVIDSFSTAEYKTDSETDDSSNIITDTETESDFDSD